MKFVRYLLYNSTGAFCVRIRVLKLWLQHRVEVKHDWLSTSWLINWLICYRLQLPSVTHQWSIVWFITDLLIIDRLYPFTAKMNLKAFAIVFLTTVLLLCQTSHSATLRSRRSVVGFAAAGSIQGGQTLSPVQVLDEWCTNLTTHLNTTLEEFVSEVYI